MQYQLFQIIAMELGWSEEDWTWSGCLGWTEMIDELLDPDGSCFMAAAGEAHMLSHIVN